MSNPISLLRRAAAGAVRRLAQRVAPGSKFSEAKPTNFRPPASSPADIEYQIEYGIRNGELNAQRMCEMGIEPCGARVLEIGPGIAFGGMAYLLAAGAKTTVADRWLAPWFDEFHTPVYSGIADRLEGRDGFDVSPIRQMVEKKNYIAGTINRIFASAETLMEIQPDSFHAIVSNAVLEHVEEIDAAFASLFRLTRPDGIGIHQVDFRDHRDFDRPLEHLLLTADEFHKLNKLRNFECGSQRRQDDYLQAFDRSGFLVERYHSNATVPEAYLDTVLKRLAGAHGALPIAWSRSMLADIGGLFQVRKPPAGEARAST